ncbi:AT-rich interactive domain-containing protein 3A [Galemys pyrenaicus]|uniref:AT-rich interactive domain-containing protein 3A n=1 Tax=Galemys pyrenaicus TaxID=202257 RepID=A0A8J6DUW3_GALPY|nr:AT-rich interactive domain-containing protein 3A [Galemys pyrenaicus]
MRPPSGPCAVRLGAGRPAEHSEGHASVPFADGDAEAREVRLGAGARSSAHLCCWLLAGRRRLRPLSPGLRACPSSSRPEPGGPAPSPPATLHCPSTPEAPTLQCGRAPSPQGPPPPPIPGARGGPARRAMKLQAVMETLLQRQQRARQELEARQQPLPPPEPPARPLALARAAPDEDREPENARMQRAQMAALAAMRAAAAGLGHAPSPSGSEDGPPGSEDEDAAQEGARGSPGPGREGPGQAEGDGHFENAGSEDELKPKWEEEEEEEEELEEDLGDEEDEDFEDEEGLGPPGPAALFPRKAPPPQALPGEGGPRALGSQERAGAGPAHPGGAAHMAPQLQPPDHGDWTYEEQFKQVGMRRTRAPRHRGALLAGSMLGWHRTGRWDSCGARAVVEPRGPLGQPSWGCEPGGEAGGLPGEG